MSDQESNLEAEASPGSTRRYLSPEQWLREHPGVFGRTSFYELLQAGRLPCVRAGRRYLVPDDLLDLMLNQKMSAQHPAP